MTISNSYIRALTANLVVFVALVSLEFYCIGHWPSQSDKTDILMFEFGGVVGLFVALLLGTLTRKSRQPWWILGLSSLGCWLAIVFVMLLLTPHAGDLVIVKP
jgi:hypothetical protein